MIRVKRCRHGNMAYPDNDIYIGRSLDIYGEYSEDEVRLFERLVQPGHTVLEIGANLGAHTVPLGRLVGPQGQVHAFEPQRFIYYLLCANVALNNLTHVICHQAAVAEVAGTLEIPELDYTVENNFGGLSLDRAYAMDSYPVPVLRVDDLRLGRCDLIKIDVEGMEKQVLEGAVGTIATFRPLLYLEDDRRDKSWELRAFIKTLGYDFHRHIVPYYHHLNFADNHTNAFENIVSSNLLCYPADARPALDLQDLGKAEDPFATECVLQGLAVARQGSLNEAMLLFREALQWQPDCGDAHYNLAVALALQGHLDEAAASYVQALEIAPSRLDAAAGLGHIADACKARGDLPGAIAGYRQVLRFQPGDSAMQYKLAVALREQGYEGRNA